MKLNKLSIKNFKGIKDLKIKFDGQNANIYGENATGKTTVYDSFLWLLFDKDSSNKKDFNIKTIDSSGNVLHMLEHEVEATIEVNSKELVLRKVLTEKWTKKRGSAEQEFDGHETNYYIDQVPVKKSEYTAKINELIDENIFKLITNPQYFNNVMTWKERRDLLLNICGDISDEQVIESDNRLAELKSILDGRSTEDHNKIIKEKTKKLNEDIDKIPVRIDELVRSKDSIEKLDYEALEAELDTLNKEIDSIDKQMIDSNVVAESYNKKLQEIASLKNKLQTLKAEIESNDKKEYLDLNTKLNLAKTRKNSEEMELGTLNSNRETFKKAIDKYTVDRNELVTKFEEVSKKEFIEPNEHDFICTTCGQSLPTADIESKIQELHDNFEKNKKKELEEINAKGKQIKENKTIYEENLINNGQRIVALESELKSTIEYITELESSINNYTQTVTDYNSNTEYVALNKQIEELESNLQLPASSISDSLKEEKASINAKISDINKKLANKDQEEKTNKRITELEQEEKTLAEKITELEGQRYLIEEFIKAKVNLLEENISSKFKMVRFKLFNTQINGGLAETCETLVNGVPYADVNNAGKINAGMDIISTLIQHFGVKAPIFVDNAESINDLYNLDTQILRLVVSRDKELKVEVL